jgi:hypothetical protein
VGSEDVGAVVGSDEGPGVGDVVGSAVGSEEVGAVVGLGEGSAVGSAVGKPLGARVP